MNLFNDIRALVIETLETMTNSGELPHGLSFANVAVEPTRNPSHGDMATNAAMVLAKPANQKPHDIAHKLVGRLNSDDRILIAEIAGPGFLNLRLVPHIWQSLVKEILSLGQTYGTSAMGEGQKVSVEFVSANPTGPLHVGHTRGAVFGDALAGLLNYAGYDVTREYYVNDGGAQVDVLARSVYLRYLEAHGKEIAFADGTYPGDYLIPIAHSLMDEVGDAYLDKCEQFWLADIRKYSIEAIMELIRDDLATLGISMDLFFSEKSLYGTGAIEASIESLRNKGLVYQGVLDPPKGKQPEDWEPREQTLFKSTDHGDDVDRPVMKSNGSWTYFAPDIAYHADKINRGYDRIINVFGADHGGYVKRMKAAVSALSSGNVELDIKLTQLVKLFKDGKPFKMSKRTGTFVTLRDLVNQVGADVTRFVMLMRKNDASLDFDFDKVLEQSRENPVYYVQYAHARGRSVQRRAAEAGINVDIATLLAVDLSCLSHTAELSVIRRLAEWPRLIEIAARTNEPHRVAFYVYELASELHTLWNKGNEEHFLRFLQQDDPDTSQAKIALVTAVCIVISAGLGILGVKPAEEMR